MSKNIMIESSNQDSSYWASRPYLGEENRARIATADVVVVPQEGFRGDPIRTFPVGTEGFYSHLRENLGNDYVVDLAIDDKEYNELALHSALIVVGTVLLKYFVAPIVVKVVADYIGHKLKGEAKKEAATVRWELIMQEQTAEGIRAVKISYDGPARDFQQEMEEAIKRSPSALVIDTDPTAKKPDAKS